MKENHYIFRFFLLFQGLELMNADQNSEAVTTYRNTSKTNTKHVQENLHSGYQ